MAGGAFPKITKTFYRNGDVRLFLSRYRLNETRNFWLGMGIYRRIPRCKALMCLFPRVILCPCMRSIKSVVSFFSPNDPWHSISFSCGFDAVHYSTFEIKFGRRKKKKEETSGVTSRCVTCRPLGQARPCRTRQSSIEFAAARKGDLSRFADVTLVKKKKNPRRWCRPAAPSSFFSRHNFF